MCFIHKKEISVHMNGPQYLLFIVQKRVAHSIMSKLKNSPHYKQLWVQTMDYSVLYLVRRLVEEEFFH